MKETLRWFGPDDHVSLENISQSGASGVVSALDHIKTGDVWELDEIIKRKNLIESYGLEWTVVESIPVHNDIKTMSGNFTKYIENYKNSIKNVGQSGVKLICYNFMAVVDWTRTNLRFELPNKSLALRFDMTDFAIYDIFILNRENAKKDYSNDIYKKAKEKFRLFDKKDIDILEKNIISGLPGGEGSYSRNQILDEIYRFTMIGKEGYRKNLFKFLKEIIPVAENSDVKMCIHPDDPPFPLFGLPRVVSNDKDISLLLDAYPSAYNGLTMCVGSYGAGFHNDTSRLVKKFKSHIHFAHLRNIIKEQDGSFYESDHLCGDNDMYTIAKHLISEEKYREKYGDGSVIPIRPDHGHLIGNEINEENVNPGYSFVGRLRGLSELRGMFFGITKSDE